MSSPFMNYIAPCDKIQNYISEAKFTDKNFTWLKNYRKKENFVVFKPKLSIPVWETAKVVHNPDVIKTTSNFFF